jgi:hypothetical protein
MSSRQKRRTTDDIFEMISENDEDIQFDECGILKAVTQSKATTVRVCLIKFPKGKNMTCVYFQSNDDYLHSSTSDTSPSLQDNNSMFSI